VAVMEAPAQRPARWWPTAHAGSGGWLLEGERAFWLEEGDRDGMPACDRPLAGRPGAGGAAWGARRAAPGAQPVTVSHHIEQLMGLIERVRC